MSGLFQNFLQFQATGRPATLRGRMTEDMNIKRYYQILISTYVM